MDSLQPEILKYIWSHTPGIEGLAARVNKHWRNIASEDGKQPTVSLKFVIENCMMIEDWVDYSVVIPPAICRAITPECAAELKAKNSAILITLGAIYYEDDLVLEAIGDPTQRESMLSICMLIDSVDMLKICMDLTDDIPQRGNIAARAAAAGAQKIYDWCHIVKKTEHLIEAVKNNQTDFIVWMINNCNIPHAQDKIIMMAGLEAIRARNADILKAILRTLPYNRNDIVRAAFVNDGIRLGLLEPEWKSKNL